MDMAEPLYDSLRTGFVDRRHKPHANHKPQLLLNTKDDCVLTTLREELETCRTFTFSVAFVTEGGLATLKTELLTLKQKGVRGRLLTSTFLSFNKPKVFEELLKMENVDVRLSDAPGFHAKGYLFEQEAHHSLIVGSSNLTARALKVNYEWNLKLTSLQEGELVHHLRRQFEEEWDRSQPLTREWIETYRLQYTETMEQRTLDQTIEHPGVYTTNSIRTALTVEPNRMQQVALTRLQALRESGERKGLVISATGTGKTYLGAFDVRQAAPRRMLFVVHREQILRKAMESFRTVLGGREEEFGLLTGGQRHLNAKYVFATVQTLSRPETLAHFSPDAFDYVLIDEVHRAGADSYRRLLEHFKPEFLLGMTATPERSDARNIFELFDFNIAYEIRLQEALAEDLLCPFHYFGVSEIEVEGHVLDEDATFNQLISTERVRHIIEKLEYYGHSGEKVHGLMFCSRNDEARELSRCLNEQGYRTKALSGEDSQAVREQVVAELERGTLDYILTVDIFNEGVDVPCVNQVVMLRKTQSSIVFVQQLGRGLRKNPGKSFVTIIDFIGNYKTNYMIPMALSGDRSLNKDNLRRSLTDSTYIEGVSTVNFEAVAKARIYESISVSRLDGIRALRETYRELKERLNKIPTLMDFVTHDLLDPSVIIKDSRYYGAFLAKMGETDPITQEESKILSFLSMELLDGKRRQELILLEHLLEGSCTYAEWKQACERERCIADETIWNNLKRLLSLAFFTTTARNQYGNDSLIVEEERLSLSSIVRERLDVSEAFRSGWEDVLAVARHNAERYDPSRPLTLYEKYSRKDACRLLNWEQDESSTMYGYKVKYGTCPIFVTYHKRETIESSIAYGDKFLSTEVFKWYTRNRRYLHSREVDEIVHAAERGTDIHLFVKKDDAEGSDFYYLGEVTVEEGSAVETTMQSGNETNPVVTMNLLLERPVKHALYHYLLEG